MNKPLPSVIEMTETLIRCPSVTPQDAGCQQHIANWLANLGFKITPLPKEPVANLWANINEASPLLVFAGHTDVVSAGPLHEWVNPPFQPTLENGYLMGRGAQDMKANLAAMIKGAESFLQNNPNFAGSLGFLITSAEEGDQCHLGTPHVLAYLKEAGINIDACVIGEPSCNERLGDTLRIGRRGSLSARVEAYGIQGHVAYAHLVDNVIHRIIPLLNDMMQLRWDSGHPEFPETSLQITHLESGHHTYNVVPGTLKFLLNFRYNPASSFASLKEKTEKLLKLHIKNYEINWFHGGSPFITAKGRLLEACREAIGQHTHIYPTPSTGGGTSDGRYIAPTGADVVEFGCTNSLIHKINEAIPVKELEKLPQIYQSIAENYFNSKKR